MGRTPCCSKIGLKRGPWTPEEDRLLISYIQKYGHDNWRALPRHAGLLRCGKSCRLRWMNYLRPDIKRGNFSTEEENAIINLHEELGNRWSAIAARLPGRTDNEIKNVWHTYLKKRLLEEKHDSNDNNNNNNNNKDAGTEAMSTAMPEFSSPQRSSGTEFSTSSSPIPDLPDSPPLTDDWFGWDELEELVFPVSPAREAEPWVWYGEGSEGVNGAAGGIDFWYNLYARAETSSNF